MALSPEQIAHFSDTDFLYDQFPSGLLSFQLDGQIVSINQTMADWTGKSTAELLSTDFRKLLEHSSMLYYDLIISPHLALHGSVTEYSLKFRTEGDDFDALFNAKSHADENGKTLVIIASVQKIDNRKKYEAELLLATRNAEEQSQLAQSEKRGFEFLFSSFPNNFWTVTPQGQLSNMNGNAASLFGSLSRRHLGVFGAVHKTDRGRILSSWRKCQAKGRKFEKELKLCDASGDPEWHLVSAEPHYNHQGELEMWFCSSTNIHHQKLLQLANQNELSTDLSTAYRNLDQKAELLLEIASDQSHMVRKPLANIIGLTALLELDPHAVDPHLLELLRQSAAELDQMIRKVSDKTASK